MSHVNYLNINAYIDAGHDPWQKDHNLLVNVHSLFKSPKIIVNSLKNVSKLFKSDDCHWNNGPN
jgi:hypothetical protein